MTSLQDARFEAFVAEHGRYLRAVIQKNYPRRLGLDVEELIQDAQVRLWQSFRSEKEIEHPASYVYRIAVSVTIDAIRRVKARRETVADGPSRDEGSEHDAVDRIADLPDPAPSPERRAELAREMERVEQALGEVSADRGRAVRLHLQGMGFEEVAMVTGWSAARARNLIYRGLADLRAILGGSK